MNDSQAQMAPILPPKPRVWTVFLTYIAGWIVILLSSVAVGIAFVVVNWQELQAGAWRMNADADDPLVELIMQPWVLAGSIILNAVGILALSGIAAALSPLPWRSRLGIDPAQSTWPRFATLLGSVATLSMGYFSAALAFLAWGGNSDSIRQMNHAVETASWPMGVVLIVAFGIAAPTAEEVLFRGYIQRRFVARFGSWTGVLLASIMFGVIHLDPQHMASAIAMGLVLGLIAQRMDSILPSILAHSIVNIIYVMSARISNADSSPEECIVSAAISAPILIVSLHFFLRMTGRPKQSVRQEFAVESGRLPGRA